LSDRCRTERSQSIARALRLPDAAKAKICLDCHADNVAPSLRGPKFQLSDGVGCEACHGGAEQWIESHTSQSSKHEDNLAKGLYPLAQPLARAERCLSCHLGTRDRFATHRIMAAGHPRLSFDLESFTERQPPHFKADADYERRKGKVLQGTSWIAGQIQGAHTALQLLRSPWFKNDAGFPEPAFYDCSSCHHTMEQYDWNRQRLAAGMEPGTLRLQTSHLQMLQVITASIEPDRHGELSRLHADLIRAGAEQIAVVPSAASALLQWLERHQQRLLRELSRAEMVRVRKALVEHGANGHVSDYATAEQLFVGVEGLSYGLGESSEKKAALDALFKSIDTTSQFSPQRFAAAARTVRGKF
ncbi:MAG: hypothetical protein HC872_06245, partial [Gammaproteobacteria bacterium]|nr:hypothetical protein [Gammaproteobacteria bacterium]